MCPDLCEIVDRMGKSKNPDETGSFRRKLIYFYICLDISFPIFGGLQHFQIDPLWAIMLVYNA